MASTQSHISDAKGHISVRLATIEDADALSEVEILARPADPSWTFRYPYRDQYPEDMKRFNREKYDSFFNQSSGFVVVLAETRDASGNTVPVGVSIWRIDKTPWYENPVKQDTAVASKPSPPQRRDEHPIRRAAMVKVHNECVNLFFSPTFDVDRYLYLMIIAVHPGYQSMGVATAMISWGFDRVKQYPGCQLGVCSSRVDKSTRLWDTKLGFRSLGAAVARSEKDEEKLEIRMEFLVWP